MLYFLITFLSTFYTRAAPPPARCPAWVMRKQRGSGATELTPQVMGSKYSFYCFQLCVEWAYFGQDTVLLGKMWLERGEREKEREHKTLTNGDKARDKSPECHGGRGWGLRWVYSPCTGRGWCHQSVSSGPVVSLLSLSSLLHSSLVSRTAPPSPVSEHHHQCQDDT